MVPDFQESIILNLQKRPFTYGSKPFGCFVDVAEAVVLPSVSSLAESVVRLLNRDEWLPQCSIFCDFSMHMRHAGEPNSLVYT